MSASSMQELLKKQKQKLAAKNSNFNPVKLPAGRSVIRILPTWRKAEEGEVEAFWATFGQHWIKTEKGGKPAAVYVCPEATYEKECQVCAVLARGQSAAKDLGDEAQQELVGESRAVQRFIVNALILTGPKEEVNTPKMVELGSQAFGQVVTIMEEYLNEGIDITDLNEGINLVVNRDGSGRDTKYTVTTHPKATKVSPAVLEKLIDIDAQIEIEFARGGEQKALSNVKKVCGFAGGPTHSTPALVHSLKDDAIETGEFEDVSEAEFEEVVDELDGLDEDVPFEEEAAPEPAPKAVSKSKTAPKASPKAPTKTAPKTSAKAKEEPVSDDDDDLDALLDGLDEID